MNGVINSFASISCIRKCHRLPSCASTFIQKFSAIGLKLKTGREGGLGGFGSEACDLHHPSFFDIDMKCPQSYGRCSTNAASSSPSQINCRPETPHPQSSGDLLASTCRACFRDMLSASLSKHFHKSRLKAATLKQSGQGPMHEIITESKGREKVIFRDQGKSQGRGILAVKRTEF